MAEDVSWMSSGSLHKYWNIHIGTSASLWTALLVRSEQRIQGNGLCSL